MKVNEKDEDDEIRFSSRPTGTIFEYSDEEIISNVDEEDLPEFYSQLQESLDMFKRFKKYN
jgi:hypothetical protein